MSSEDFYDSLPHFDDFARITDLQLYRPLPSDWCVVVADIVDSTGAVQRGRYKQVNIVGAAVITGVLNAIKPMRVPFAFGGDGATLCIPDSVAGDVGDALAATQLMARRELDLELRVGIMPVGDITANEHHVLLAGYWVSPHYKQAIFSGGGLQFAEQCVKDAQRGQRYRIVADGHNPRCSYVGLECRWEDIPSPHDETITLLVQATCDDDDDRAALYHQVITHIEQIYGDSDACRPVRLDGMRLTRSNQKLANEARLRSFGHSRLFRLSYWLWLKFQMTIAYVLFARNLKFGGVDWGRYQCDAVSNTDFRKFDDVLRHVLAGSAQQRAKLTQQLDRLHAAGQLVYGLEVSPSALMTCMIFNRDGEHVHFIDGSRGGYALAATQLKQQLKRREGVGFRV